MTLSLTRSISQSRILVLHCHTLLFNQEYHGCNLKFIHGKMVRVYAGQIKQQCFQISLTTNFVKRIPLKKSTNRIRSQTTKKAAQNREIARIKGEWQKERRVCFFCGKPFDDVVHVIRRAYSDDLYSDIQNLIPGCRTCHTTFDDGPREKVRQLQNLNKVLAIMDELDHFYCNRYKMRYGID